MPVVRLEGVALASQGSTLDFELSPGQTLSVFGPSGSGKSQLLRCLSGSEKPPRGAVQGKKSVVARVGDISRKATPNTLARDATRNNSSLSTDLLSAVGLWEHRNMPVGELPNGLQAACAMVTPLSGSQDLLIIDGVLERLDPWTRRTVLDLLRQRIASGGAAAIATDVPDLASEFDRMVLLGQDKQIVFQGSKDELMKAAGEVEIYIETANEAGARAIVEPLELKVRKVEGGLIVRASEGQALAVRLLCEGYGDVRMVILQQPTTTQAMLRLHE